MGWDSSLLTASDTGEVKDVNGLRKGFIIKIGLVALRTHFLRRREQIIFSRNWEGMAVSLPSLVD